ncbi:hypothetical protein GCM10027168_21040 [Streptomyces capparidis]
METGHTEADVQRRVRAIIGGQLTVPEEELGPDRQLRSLPNVDSMRVLQIILEVESAFGIEVDDDVTFRIETVGQFEELVVRLCRERASA